MNLVKMQTSMAYKYRNYPTRSQMSRLENQFPMCRYLYNWNLHERINAYKEHRKTISYNQQQNALPGLKKERPWFKFVNSQVLQDVLRRLNRACYIFFCRVKQGPGGFGFPRFKKPGVWDSISYPQYKQCPAVDHIKVSKIGDLKIRYNRDIPNNNKFKNLIISKEAGKWFTCKSFEGIISNEAKFETYSRFFGNDFLYKTTNDFLAKGDLICFEDLKIKDKMRRL